MHTGGKGGRGLKRSEEFPPHFAYLRFFIVTGRNIYYDSMIPNNYYDWQKLA